MVVTRGETATVIAVTVPDYPCSINYTTPSGKTSEADGLEKKRADSAGQVSWTWLIQPDTPVGHGRVAVACKGSPSAEVRIVIK